MLTDDESRAELIKRLRESTQLTDKDCTDDQLIMFKRGTLLYYWLIAGIKLADFKQTIFDNFRGKRYYKREYLRYQRLYNTLLAENACYRRRNAALRGKLTEMRHERHVKRQNESSGR